MDVADTDGSPVADLDVVVVGGGIQGLVLLREVVAAGYDAVLVTRDAVGTGQTLHSHGALVSGVGLFTGGLASVVDDEAVPYLRRLGVAVRRDDPSVLVLTEALIEALAPVWQANGYRPERIDPSVVPGLETELPTYRVPGRTVDKHALVAGLVRGLEEHVIRGEVVGGGDSVDVRTSDGGTRVLHPRAVIVAAGCATRRLLRDAFGVQDGLRTRISYTTLHMVCIRAPAGVLPTVGAVATPDLVVVGHPPTDGPGSRRRAAIWYATPADPTAQPYDQAPDDAIAPVDAEMVARAVAGLQRVFPALRGDDDRVQATVYAGHKQQIDGAPTTRACELVDDHRTLIVCLPSVLANAVPNAADAVAILRDRVDPSRRSTPVPGAGGVAVGDAEEDGRGDWRPWGAFARAHAG